MKKPILLLLLVAIGAAGYWLGRHAAPAGEAAEKSAEAEVKGVAQVEVTPLITGTISQTLEVFGVVGAAPAAEVTTAAKFDCIVTAVHVVAGEQVAAGDALLDVSPSPDWQLQLESARSTLSLATKIFDDTQARQQLHLATGQDLLTAEQAKEDARIKLASLEARGDGRIVAANPGVVSALPAAAGMLATAGTALISVVTDGKMEVRLGVQTSDVSQVNPGQPVTLLAINRNNTASISSQVRLVGGPLDATSGTAEVRVPVPVGATLRLGEHVQALIEVRKKSSALIAPHSAVLPDEDKQVLFTVKDGKAVRHEVELGITTDDQVEVLGEDLHEGDPVVTLGNYELEDKMTVQAKEAVPVKKDGGDEDDEDAAASPAPKEAKP